MSGDMSITNSGTSSVTGVVAGSGDFTKAGSGMLSLTGANTYSGDTTVSAGTLRLSGTGTLGSGSYSGAITNNGIFKQLTPLKNCVLTYRKSYNHIQFLY